MNALDAVVVERSSSFMTATDDSRFGRFPTCAERAPNAFFGRRFNEQESVIEKAQSMVAKTHTGERR
jgi:hypothetical protein